MDRGEGSFRFLGEVIPYQSSARRWKDININIGAAQSTLQDIKISESAGGYAYNDSNRAFSVTRNRFIFWKINHDVLELTEHSLDLNLSKNNVRFHFQDTSVLEEVSVHETNSYVVILVATVSSVHRLIFTHPSCLQQHEYMHGQSTDQTWPSVFDEASTHTARDPSSFHVLVPSAGGSSLPHIAGSWLTNELEAIFVIGSSHGKMLIVRLPSFELGGSVTTNDLQNSSVMKRMWPGFLPNSILQSQDFGEMAFSVCLHPLNGEVFIFAMCRDGKLRVWSCSSYECVMVLDMLQYIPETLLHHRKQQGPQPHILRKSLVSTHNCLYLGIYLCFSDCREICVVKASVQDQQPHLEIVATLHGPSYHLIDLALTTTHVWALWTTSESETILNFTSFDGGSNSGLGWIPVTLEEPISREFRVPEGVLEPREAFMHKIFTPGNFSVQTITKAISIYRRSLDTAIMGEINVPVNVLKEEVCTVVEHQIHAQASEYELADESFYQLQLDCWSKFYSCCLQYQEVENKMMGLMLDPHTGMVGVIKKSFFSFLRSQDPIESLILSRGILPSDQGCLSALSDNPSICRDLLSLSKCLAVISSHQSTDMKEAFEQDLFHQQSPEKIVPVMLSSLLSSGEDNAEGVMDLHQELSNVVNTMPYLLEVIEIILATLDLAHGEPQGLVVEDGIILEASQQLSCNRLFSSQIGSSLIAESVRQMAQIRLELCRDLLLLLFWLQNTGDQNAASVNVLDRISCDLIPQASTLTQAYYILLWSSQTVASDVTRNAMESRLCQLSLMNVTDSAPPFPKPQKTSPQPVTLVELFVQQDGGARARILLARNHFLDNEENAIWTQALSPLISIVGQLLWPISINFAFPEFLLIHCQYFQLAEYVRLLQTWCKWNSCSRKFLLGHAYLNLGEPDKATDQFLEGVIGIYEEDFLLTKILQANPATPYLSSLYFIRVIRLLEQFGLPDQIITLAKAAVGMADKDDVHLPTLWSILFKYHLELHHNEEAFSAINANPDDSRKKDCLRQFVVILCDRSQYKMLVEFHYTDLHDDLVTILESRARSVDLTTHNYYDVLYSFHIFRGNYRKAGAIMYEHGIRLGKEVPGLKGIQQQVKCYLAVLNCLSLVNQNYAWIVKPVPYTEVTDRERSMVPGMSPKRNSDGDEISADAQVVDRQMVVLELDDIRKEYDLLHARLQLYHQNQDLANITGYLTPEESVGLLLNSGLYDTAFHICRIFRMSYCPVVEDLASRCVKLSEVYWKSAEDASIIEGTWNWLSKNDLTNIHVPVDHNAADFAWKLLQAYVEIYEKAGHTGLLRCVARRILSLGGYLPFWLITSYKLRNVMELVLLYVEYDFLEDATDLVIEFFDAEMGKGNEYFGLKSVLHAGRPSVLVPYTAVEYLTCALKDEDKDQVCEQKLQELGNKLTEYYNELVRVSRDMIALETTKIAS